MADNDDKDAPEPKTAPAHPIQETVDLFGSVLKYGDIYQLDKYGNINLPKFLWH